MLNGFGEAHEIAALVEQLAKEHDVGGVYSTADVSKPDEVFAMVGHAARRFGHVDILVNNVGLTKVVALETARTGVTSNAICPGWVLTPPSAAADRRSRLEGAIGIAEAKRTLLAEKQPSEDFVAPEELGALAVFLCGSAAAQIRGAAISIDGGWTAQ
jgi:3-hydroxybutyrate dehydrogenase